LEDNDFSIEFKDEYESSFSCSRIFPKEADPEDEIYVLRKSASPFMPKKGS